MSWILAKLDRMGIRVVRGFSYDVNDRSWAE
jgi:hypothetical protein